MEISRYWFRELPARLPEGIYIVIDVWGATTNITSILSQNPQHLFIVNETSAQEIHLRYPGVILIGESLTAELPFVVSNYPNDVVAASLNHKIVALTTTNGTKVFETLKDVPTVISAAFNNLHAVSSWLKNQGDEPVMLIMAGEPTFHAEEDELCANALDNQINDISYDWPQMQTRVKQIIIDNESGRYGHQLTPQQIEGIDTLLQKDLYQIVPYKKTPTGKWVEIAAEQG